MQLEIENVEARKTQQRYARLAGSLFLGVIIIALGGSFVLSRVAGSGTFAETAARIAASERWYRVALSIAVIATLGSALLAFTLYATLKPVNSMLAQLAMIFALGDSFLALLVRMCGFVRLHLYLSAQTSAAGPVFAQVLSELIRNIAGVTENLGGIAFGIGSLLFFFLFFKSRYVPRMLSALGLFASMTWIGLYFATLVFPEERAVFQIVCFPPLALADVITGFYLMLFGVRIEGRGDPSAQHAVISESNP
jgi:hypothetical protein